MKIITFFLFAACLTASAGGEAQKVTLSQNNVKLEKVFREIKKQTGYVFFYEAKVLEKTKSVSVHVKDMSVEEVLKECLVGQPVDFSIQRKTVTIVPKEINKSPGIGMNVSSLRVADIPMIPANIITGKVKDAEGHALAGVSVIVKGTQKGTSTDNEGDFSIEAEVGEVLEFSFIGFTKKTLTVTQNSNVLVVMEISATIGDEVVVVGYGTQTKKELTGSISRVTLEGSPMANIPNVNTLQAIKGKVAGLNIGTVTSSGGEPGFTIRGQNSLSASNTPLLVVDGIIYQGSFSTLNPNDIASIDVLKDASAAAVYGSRSANGVIIVTTKEGKMGEPVININSYYGLQNYTHMPEMMNGEQAVQFRKDFAIVNGATGSDLDLKHILNSNEYKAYQEGHAIDWYDEITRKAPLKNLQVSLSGATKNINYYLSGNIMDQTGIVVGDQYNKKSVLLKLDSKVTNWLKIGVNLNADARDYSGNEANFYWATYLMPYGYKNVQFPEFDQWLERYPGTQTTWSNPLWGIDNYNLDKRYNYNATGFAEVKVPWIRGLKYRFNYSLHRTNTEQAGFTPETNFVNTLKIGDLQNPGMFLKDANGYKNNSTGNDWLLNNILTFNRTFVNNHNVDITLMSERQEIVGKSSNLSAKDFSAIGSSVLGVDALQFGNNQLRGISSGYSKLTQMAYLFRTNYNYKSKYHATFSIRRDGYSGFAEGNKYGDFKAVGLAWTISEESFMNKSINFLSYLKLRLSYGENGNPSIGSYGTLPGIGNSQYIFGTTTVNTAYQSNLSNANLQWEKTGAYNLGIDFTVVKDRISGSVDVYHSETTNLLMTRSLPIMTGYGSILANLGQINNEGLELNLNTVNIKDRDFTWKSNFVFWKNKNKIVRLYGKDASGNEKDDLGNRWFIGKSLGAIYDYTFDGIVQAEDKTYQQQYGALPGDVKFKDLNDNGKIDVDDRSIIGYTKPNFTFTVSNTFQYKNFDLYFSVEHIDGGNNHYLAGNTKGLSGPLVPGVSRWVNVPYWMADRQGNQYPRPNYTNPFGYGFYQNHSFWRLSDLTLGYSFDNEILSRIKVKNLKVYFSAKNLITLSDWIGLDPESATQIGEYTLPGLKMSTFGLNLTL